MKATGVVRRIDDLGRVVIPKEIRRTLRIREGDPLEIFTQKDGEVIFKKYSPIGELSNFASVYAESLYKTSSVPVCITDKDVVIAVSGAPKKELLEKRISSDLEKILDERMTYTQKDESVKRPLIVDVLEKYKAGIIVPIIAEGDVIGSVIFFSSDDVKMGEIELKLAQSAASFLGRHMEDI